MMPRISERDRRSLMRGGMVVIAILLLGRVVPVALKLMNNEVAEALRLSLERARAVDEVKSLPELRDSARARRLRLGDEFPTLLHGNGDAALVAAVVAEINEDASDNAAFVSNIEAHTDTTRHLPYVPVDARVDVVGDVRGIAGLVSTIESSGTRMRITELSLTQSDPAAGTTQLELLHAALRVQALGRAPNPPNEPIVRPSNVKVFGVTTP